MASADQISCRNLGRRSGRRPLRKRHRQCQAAGHAEGAGSPINHPSQRRTAKRLRQRMRGNGWKLRQRSSPKYPATSDNPSVTAAPCQLPLHKGAFGPGDADCRVASLLAMTVLILCHSEEAQQADVGIRPFYDGRGFGPMYLGHGLRRPNFVPKFGRRSWASAPTPCGGRHAGSSCPTGGCGGLHQLPGGNRRAAKRPRPQPRGMGGNRRKDHPKKGGTAPRPPRQRLAKRKARKAQLVKFGLCPMTSLFSTAYQVR